MTANPWDKWYWNDWENDPALKLCSLSAQGLWMRMLCICAKADPKGYLLVAGHPLPPPDLATLVGKSEAEVEMLLSELASKGVYSLDRKSRIYSRRMVRDVQKARTARQNGKMGGNPSLWNARGNQPSDNPTINGEDKTHKPDTRSQKKEETSSRTKSARRRISYPDDFEAFWKAYPTDALMSKKATAEAWSRLPEEDRALAVSSVPAFRQHCAQHPDYRPVHAVRYLTQRRFDGMAEIAARTGSMVHIKQGTPQWKAWEEHWRATKGKSPPVDGNGGWRFPADYPELSPPT